MFDELFSYDPSAIDPEYRERMALILQARSEMLAATSEVAALRARVWAGEIGLGGLIELKAAELAKLRSNFNGQIVPFLKEVVDLEHFKSLVPMLAMVVMQGLKVPLPVLAESVGVDFDHFKLLAEQLKDVISDL